jgi:6-phosphogluconolactonase (cycloisomerase 2 family)
MSTDPAGKHLFLANYGGGNIVALGINPDGSLGILAGMILNHGSGPCTGRQDSPHPHAVTFDPSGRFIASPDQGTDQILILAMEAAGPVQINAAKVSPGSGPRHAAFRPDGKGLYVVNELAGSITTFPFDARTGVVGEEIQTIPTLPDDFPANKEKGAAGIIVHPTGKFLYASNRKSANHPMADSIVAYRIDQVTSRLTLIGYTTEGIVYPRTINFDPTGKWLYVLNQKSDTIVRFTINLDTGELVPTGLVFRVKVPVSIVFKA